jgi:hypothetical protein
MTLAVPGRSLRVAGWGLPILAVLCCAPSVARADCGDYVVTRVSHSGDMTPARHAGAAELPMRAQPHRPCHGPNCSRGPAVPLLPAPTVPAPAPSEWGWLTATPTPVPPDREHFFSDSPSPHPTHLASSIFHPPRRAA